jgi:hypothetical protein
MTTPLAGIVVVLGSIALSVIGLLIVRGNVHTEWLKRHRELASCYFHIIGTLYAVLIAFAIYVVWGGFKEAGTNLAHEATEVADLSRLSTAMPDELRKNITTALMEYLNAVADDEFPAMQQGRSSDRTWTAVQRLWDVYGNAQPDTPRLQAYFNESLRHLTQLSDLRRTRLFASRGVVPQILWCLLTVAGVLLVGFAYFVGHEGIATQAMMTACLAGVLSFSMFLILSLNHPYSGVDHVIPEPFKLELSHVASRMPK